MNISLDSSVWLEREIHNLKVVSSNLTLGIKDTYSKIIFGINF